MNLGPKVLHFMALQAHTPAQLNTAASGLDLSARKTAVEAVAKAAGLGSSLPTGDYCCPSVVPVHAAVHPVAECLKLSPIYPYACALLVVVQKTRLSPFFYFFLAGFSPFSGSLSIVLFHPSISVASTLAAAAPTAGASSRPASSNGAASVRSSTTLPAGSGAL